MVVHIIIIVRTIVHHHRLVNLIAIDILIDNQRIILFGQNLPVSVIIIKSRPILPHFSLQNPPAQSIVSKYHHRRAVTIRNQDDAVFNISLFFTELRPMVKRNPPNKPMLTTGLCPLAADYRLLVIHCAPSCRSWLNRLITPLICGPQAGIWHLTRDVREHTP